ncbi:MAG: RluA family pseudouridine synthase [Bacilli bacterium]
MENLIITYSGEPVRIDKYITGELSDVSRTQVQMMINNEFILVNDEAVKSNYILRENDEISIEFVAPVETDIEPENIALDIYYEDSDIIVVNKPEGMVVHPAPGNYKGTLVNALLYHCKDLSGINGEIRAGIVHRIDKDTSGLLVSCKNDISHRHLSQQFHDKKVNRRYIAICSGVIPHNLGKINAPIGRHPVNRQQMTVRENGKHAITNFKVLDRFKNHTLVELSLETGRTHQIRVHMKYIGFPVTGDPIYGNKGEISQFGQFLHAKTLGFIHPTTKKYVEFESPLPDYFDKFIKSLKDE